MEKKEYILNEFIKNKLKKETCKGEVGKKNPYLKNLILVS
jgi:hypothetical protein